MYRTKLSNSTCYFLSILTLTFGIDFTEGLKWITKPSQINKCIGQNANLTWEYEKEAAEEIRQLQWRFDSTNVIAYSSKRNGFHVAAQYQGRVERSGENGILLKNISAKDIGNYTLYPVIAWEETPNIPKLLLNVIGTTMQRWCTCERISLLSEWSGGRMFSIVADACHLEINSSFCCPKGPVIECIENDPQKLCVPITNLYNQSRNPNNLTGSTTQSNLLPEQRDLSFVVQDTKDPVLVQKRNIESDRVMLALLVTNTSSSFLVICCVVYVIWRIRRN